MAKVQNASELDPRKTLIDKLKTDDSDAWELLYEIYSPLISHWARGNGVTCTHEHSDIVQDVFTKVMKSIGSYKKLEGRGSFQGWLYTITRNHINSNRHRGPATVGGSCWQRRMREIPFPKLPAAQRFDSVWERRQPRVDQKSKLASKILAWIDKRCKSKNRNKSIFKDLLTSDKSASELAEDHNVTTNVIYQIKSRMVAQIREVFSATSVQSFQEKSIAVRSDDNIHWSEKRVAESNTQTRKIRNS